MTEQPFSGGPFLPSPSPSGPAPTFSAGIPANHPLHESNPYRPAAPGGPGGSPPSGTAGDSAGHSAWGRTHHEAPRAQSSSEESPPASSGDEGDAFVWPDAATRESRRRKRSDGSSAGSSDGGGDDDAGDERPKRATKRKAKKRASKRSKVTAPPEDEGGFGAGLDGGEDSGGPPSAEEGGDEGEPRKKSRRRGKRGGRRRKKSEGASEEAADDAADDAPQERDEDAEDAPRSRKRGTRGGRRRKKSAAVEVEVIPGEEDDFPELPEEAVRVEDDEEAGGRSRKVKGGRRKQDKKKSARDDEESEGRSKRKKKTAKKAKKKTKQSKKSRRSRDEDDEAEFAAPEEPQKARQILVNAGDPEETRVVVVEEGRVVDLQMTASKHANYVSDIYRGRVVNLESAIGAAFVDFGQGKNGFLHASDVLPCYGEDDFTLDKLLTTPVDEDDWSESGQPDVSEELDDADDDADSKGSGGKKGKPDGKGADGKKGRGARSRGRTRRPRLPIEKLVKKGQMICVQITKDAIGDKGPTLTTYISIPGRYLVLMPSLARTGVSRKIDDDRERRRLKRILQGLEIPDGMGVIVRTAGVGRTKAELKRDLDYLLAAWEDFSRRLVSGRNPAPLYQESDVAIKTMRDLFTSNVETVVVDDPDVHGRVVEFTKKLMPEHVERIQLHDGPRPILQSHGVESDFEKIFSKRVELPSGGSIIIEQTEALVSIDVNSGRTREEGAGFEDIALKTNLEAVPEIARQIRLRDLGGIIVLDYIDMMRSSSRRAVERATREALRNDRARSKVGRISQFGLLELTRQRLGPGLDKLVYETCRSCRGSGRRRSASSRAQAILRRLGASLTLKGFTTVEVRAHPDAIEYLKRSLSKELKQLEEDSGRKIVLMSVPDQVEDSVLHYLRADGREVRPGGRRKRR